MTKGGRFQEGKESGLRAGYQSGAWAALVAMKKVMEDSEDAERITHEIVKMLGLEE